jgi:dipeptidyl aminopeptidase/acylaminoacyl peptidase
MRKYLFPFLAIALLSSGRADPPQPSWSRNRPVPKTPAQQAPSGKEPWSVADVVQAEMVTDFQVSPDGRWCVWIKNGSDLFRTDLETGDEVQLTRTVESCAAPRWSPDGSRLAFLGGRAAGRTGDDKTKAAVEDDARAQLWLIDPTGGEPWPLTERVRGLDDYGWAGNDALVFVAQEEPSLREKQLKEDKDGALVVEDEKHEPPARLFRIAVDTKKITRLTDNRDRIMILAISPDGRKAVTSHDRSLRYTFDEKIQPRVCLVDLETGQRKPIFRDAKFRIDQAAWARDGKGFYAVNWVSSPPHLRHTGVAELYWFDLAAGAAVKIDLDWDKGLAEQGDSDDVQLVVTADGFLALLADGVRNKAARYVRDGGKWRREWLTGRHVANLFGLSASADGKAVVYAYSTASTPTQWYRAQLDGGAIEKPVPFATVNEHFADRQRAKTEVIRWKGALGEEVEGVLYYPHAYKEGEKRPLVVMLHGGPASADLDCWQEDWSAAPNLLCRRGAFVLRPNYHGSSNYGLKWLESIAGGKFLDLEVEDVEKGIDYLIGRGLVDAKRLGLTGWSNGANLVNALTVRSPRYQAAVAGAGVVDYVSDWANCEFGQSYCRYYFGKSPLEDPGLYQRKSPFPRLDRVRTPTLILFGNEDRVVPTQQGWMHYRALQQLGKAEVRFVLFPGEKHSLGRLAHQRRKLEEELAWFGRHLFGTKADPDESLKPDSPLARALALRQAQRDNGRYGVVEKGELIPETVSHAGLQLGRFEVTCAQYAAFDKAYRFEPGRANHPATGRTFAQAKAYCAWLSKHTGRTYRLPTEAEGEELYGAPEAGENTLDAWAGYAPNPEDAARLRAKAKDLEGVAPLLREVGSSGRGGSAGVYDLGGNAAEWVERPDGTGKVCGGSADAPADAKQKASLAAPAYRGFRVVLGPPR